jgi:hypothetical protein
VVSDIGFTTSSLSAAMGWRSIASENREVWDRLRRSVYLPLTANELLNFKGC